MYHVPRRSAGVSLAEAIIQLYDSDDDEDQAAKALSLICVSSQHPFVRVAVAICLPYSHILPSSTASWNLPD